MNGIHQEAAKLCREGDKILFSGDPGKAAALYTHAFRNHAGSAVAHMRGLDPGRLEEVISMLEAWLDVVSPNSIEGLSKGLVAVFLSTLCPNNISASVFKMESVLQGAGHGSDEIFERCSNLLEGKQMSRTGGQTRLVLELTRALACLLSDLRNPEGPQLYLQAFHGNKSETIRLVKERQKQHVPVIIKAFYQQMSQRYCIFSDKHQLESSLESEHIDPYEAVEFLLAVSPDDIQIRELQAAVLFSSERFVESVDALTLTLRLDEPQTKTNACNGYPEHPMSPEKRASLMVGRAAAHFSAGGRADEVCKDLSDAFGLHLAAARQQFQSLFSDSDIGVAACIRLRQQAEKGVTEFREAVLTRADLRLNKGVELLDPVIAQLRTLCHLESGGGGRELRVRLADCLLMRGEHREALSISSQLAAAAPSKQSYQNTVQVLQGFSHLFTDDQKSALEDFQAVIEHNAPHPPSCVRALCGRGILRMMDGSHYLTALDYITASRLQLQDTALTVRCLVPWNYRGLLCTVLLEQGRSILEGTSEQKADSDPRTQQVQEHEQSNNNQRIAVGVHALALLLTELQPGAYGPQILTADALYKLGRVEEAYRLLLNIERTAPRPPVLARLAILQLHRGFLYDAYQECTQDILVALQSDAEEVTRSMLSLKDKARKLICEWLGQHCHSSLAEILLANPVPCRKEHLREAFLIAGALMNTDCREPRWHLLYIDTLLAKGEVNAAGGHLKQVFGQEPREATAKARWGVVKAWHQNYTLAANYLSEVAEKEPATLDFLIGLMQMSQRKRVAEVASKQASSVSQSGQWEHALALLTLAGRAVNDKKLHYLRQRAACLAHLGLHERAVSDLNKVIEGHSYDNGEEDAIRTEDLCRRGRSLLLCSCEESGLQDFSQALDLHEEQALLCVEAGPGRQRLAELFLRFALQHFGEQQLDKAWLLTENGLKVESDHAELRRLKARIKREVSGPCTVH
ncbi:Tetratricopeptide repeat protein 34 [Triplophysa tibetana]|uniref:Tetratricopeptide repeat protein 34 n=1 Tax=Triplophysa tibetana TaxID=1572043 RepID=A0A5A9NCJ6_9TELE|nr:Tetratricopeptide repeat protein 34 [Triplophysa tibetana]